jgi:hypothetical protein
MASSRKAVSYQPPAISFLAGTAAEGLKADY